METSFRQEGTAGFQGTQAQVPLLCVMVTLVSACSFDESKLRASSARALDGAIEHAADADQVGVGTEGATEVGQVDARATDVPPAAGADAIGGQDGSGANRDTVLDGATGDSADADSVPSGTEGAVEVGQVDSGATDQAPPTAGSDASGGQDSAVANPDMNLDVNVGTAFVADGTYRMIARHSGKALDVYWEATADGSNVDQWTYDGGKNQQWMLTQLGGNVYEILGVQSGKALEVATLSTADDTNVDIRTYTGAANQQWTISAVGDGYFRLTPVSSSGSALDVSGMGLFDGANVHQWTWLGGNNYNQQWAIVSP